MSVSSNKRRNSGLVVGGLAAAMVVSVAATGAQAAPAAPAASNATKNAACAPTDGVTPTTITLGWLGPKTGAVVQG